jgi:hypothetical protein
VCLCVCVSVCVCVFGVCVSVCGGTRRSHSQGEDLVPLRAEVLIDGLRLQAVVA